MSGHPISSSVGAPRSFVVRVQDIEYMCGGIEEYSIAPLFLSTNVPAGHGTDGTQDLEENIKVMIP